MADMINVDREKASFWDGETEFFLKKMAEQEKLKSNRFAGIRTVLIVLSSTSMAFDIESLRQKTLLAYPEAAVFFMTTLGKSIGSSAPQFVDLLIDLTGPNERQGLFFSKKLRKMTRVAVGRNAGLFRKKIYDRVFDEKTLENASLLDKLAREQIVQREVMALAGVAFVPTGDTPPDRGKTIALELPPMVSGTSFGAQRS